MGMSPPRLGTGNHADYSEFAQQMANLGARRFIYTDIVRDGTLTEPNFSAISELIQSTKLRSSPPAVSLRYCTSKC